MTTSHLERLRKELEANHWVVVEENDDMARCGKLSWRIARPNGDCPLELEFTPGHSKKHLGVQLEDIESAIACDIVGHDEVPYLYFSSKFSGKFQQEVVRFVDSINEIDNT
jgi:hypothetical protein